VLLALDLSIASIAAARLGDVEMARRWIARARECFSDNGLLLEDRFKLICAMAEVFSAVPADEADEGIRELASSQLPLVSDSFSDNTHFCFSVVAFFDGLVVAAIEVAVQPA